MYIPRAFRQADVDELLAFMRAHSFITLVSILDGAPFASHVPVVVRRAGDAVTWPNTSSGAPTRMSRVMVTGGGVGYAGRFGQQPPAWAVRCTSA